MADVFISYSRANAGQVRPLVAELESRLLDVWLDVDDIEPSLPWLDEVRSAISESRLFIACDSATWRDSVVCQLESATAEDWAVPVFWWSVDEDFGVRDVPAAIAEMLAWLGEDAVSRTQLVARARRWEAAGRPRGLLSRAATLKADLAYVERWPTTKVPLDVAEYLGEAQKAAQRRRTLRIANAFLLGFLIYAVYAITHAVGAVSDEVEAVTSEFLRTAAIGANTRGDPLVFVVKVSETEGYPNFATYELIADALAIALPESAEPYDETDDQRAVTVVPLVSDDGSPVEPVAVTSHDGRFVAQGSSRDGRVTVSSVDSGELRSVVVASGPVFATAFSPDGENLAVVTGLGIEVLPIRGGERLALVSLQSTIAALWWSSDTQVDALAKDDLIWSWTPFAEASRVGPGIDDRARIALAKGGVVVATDRDGSLVLRGGGSELRAIEADPSIARILDFESDSNRELVVSVAELNTGAGVMTLIDVGAPSRTQFELPNCFPLSVAVSTEPQGAFYSCIEGTVGYVAFDSGSASIPPVTIPTQATAIALVGDELILGSYIGEVLSMSLDLETQEVVGFPHCGGQTADIAIRADGNQAALAGTTSGGFACSQILERANPSDAWALYGATFNIGAHDRSSFTVGYSADGVLLAFGFTDGSIIVMESRGMRVVSKLRPTTRALCSVDFPDDTRTMLVTTCDGYQLVVPGAGSGTSADEMLSALRSKLDALRAIGAT